MPPSYRFSSNGSRRSAPAASSQPAASCRAQPAILLLLVLTSGLGSGSSGAQDDVIAVAGAGSRTCAQMQADIADLPNTRRAYVSWMQGYLSGRNAAREADGRALVDIADYEAQWDWIVRWCGERPENGFAEAVNALFDERAAP